LAQLLHAPLGMMHILHTGAPHSEHVKVAILPQIPHSAADAPPITGFAIFPRSNILPSLLLKASVA
jgi:hypothetical protein